MIMKKILLVFSCLAMFACESMVDTPNPSFESKPNLRSIDEVKSIALEALQKIPNKPSVKSMHTQIVDVCSIGHSKTKSISNDPVMYSVNFSDSSGFVLVAADSSKPALLAVVNSGNYSGEQTDCPAFNAYIDDLTAELSKSSVQQRSLIVPGFQRYETDTTTFTRQVAPHITCNWHQRDPFNRYCYTDSGQIALAGCGAVAIALAMSRYSYPAVVDLTFEGAPCNEITIDWDICKSHNRNHGECGVCDSNALLLREIGERCNMHYGDTASTSVLDSAQVCLTSFGYKFQRHNSFDINPVISSLDQGETVIIRGDRIEQTTPLRYVGHRWNVDGYYYIEETINCYKVTDGSLIREYEGYKKEKLWYLYFNYGWRNSAYNGYYIAYSRQQGEGWYFYEPVDEPVITMFQCTKGYTNRVEMLTNVSPN